MFVYVCADGFGLFEMSVFGWEEKVYESERADLIGKCYGEVEVTGMKVRGFWSSEFQASPIEGCWGVITLRPIRVLPWAPARLQTT